MGSIQRKKVHPTKECARCGAQFRPTGPNTKRCSKCRYVHHLEYCKEKHHSTYIKKGYNQKGEKNNAWKGGVSPAYYQRIAFSIHGLLCVRCSRKGVLVHHLDGDHANSSPDNLEVLCKRCHQVGHDCASNLPKKVEFKKRYCEVCSKSFQPTGPRSKRCHACGGKGAKV